MRKIVGFIFALSLFASCNLNGSSDKYFIEGNIKNSPVKSIKLDKLSLQNIVTVDTAAVDDKGNFHMEGVSEKGFYRIKLDDRTFYLFLLEPAHYQFAIDVDGPEPIKITGPADNDEFQAAFKKVQAARQQMDGWNAAYQLYTQRGTTQDTIEYLQQNLKAAGANFESTVVEGAKNAKSPLVAMFYITNIQMDKFSTEAHAVVERLEKEIPNSSYTKELKSAYDNLMQQAEMKKSAENISIGKPAPELALKNPDGKEIKLSSLKGKVVLLDFWASWCGPCRMEMPNVVAAYKKYKDKGFTVYSVSLDKDAAAWKAAIGTLGMIWENHVSDLKWWQSDAAKIYNIQSIPQAFLIDRNGNIVATELRGPALDRKIAEIIQ